MHYGNAKAKFGASLGVTLKDIRSHFWITGGSLTIAGEIKVVKEEMVVPPYLFVRFPNTNKPGYEIFHLPLLLAHISRSSPYCLNDLIHDHS